MPKILIDVPDDLIQALKEITALARKRAKNKRAEARLAPIETTAQERMTLIQASTKGHNRELDSLIVRLNNRANQSPERSAGIFTHPYTQLSQVHTCLLTDALSRAGATVEARLGFLLASEPAVLPKAEPAPPPELAPKSYPESLRVDWDAYAKQVAARRKAKDPQD